MTNSKNLKNEKEHEGSIWTHPYMIYILLTTFIFLFLIIMGWFALENGWIPSR